MEIRAHGLWVKKINPKITSSKVEFQIPFMQSTHRSYLHDICDLGDLFNAFITNAMISGGFEHNSQVKLTVFDQAISYQRSIALGRLCSLHR